MGGARIGRFLSVSSGATMFGHTLNAGGMLPRLDDVKSRDHALGRWYVHGSLNVKATPPLFDSTGELCSTSISFIALEQH